MTRRHPIPTVAAAAVVAVALPLAACSDDSAGPQRPTASATSAPSATSAAQPTTTTPTTHTTTTPTTHTTTIAPSTTAPTTIVTTTTLSAATDEIQEVVFGRSREGRPLVAVERGTPGGTVVLVIGVIHGDEPAGTAVVDRLMTLPVPAGVDLWLVPSINPDGQAAATRQNQAQVDLNRNFPFRWAPLGAPGDDQYAGSGPASEPETEAITGLISLLQPTLGLWYHQDLFRIAPASGRAGEVRRRYAELTGLPIAGITGGTYTGTAASWQRQAVPGGVSFIVELGPTLSAEEADRHARAVLALAEGA